MPARDRAALAIDLGSTDLKVGLVALDGALLAVDRAPVAADDPVGWWSALVRLVPAVVAQASAGSSPGAGPEVVAICTDGHGPTLVAANADGEPVAPSVPWSDRRAEREAAELADRTGLGTWALGVLPAALWLERADPPLAARVRWYLNSWEWLALRLSGTARRTRSAGQELADPSSRALAEVLSPDRTPPTVDAGTVVGGLTRDAAAALRLPEGTPVVAGLNDAFAACLGVGLLEPGDAYDAGGSAGGFAVYTDRQVAVAGAFGAAAPVPGRWYVGAVMSATGRALDWLAATTGATSAALLGEAASVRPGADGLVFLPYLAGERSPIWDPEARGAFVGLTLRHGRPAMARAVLEGAALALRHVTGPIVAAGVPVREMRVTGRTAESGTWNRIKADVTGFPVAVPAVSEAALVGCGILSAVATGASRDIPDAIRSMVRIVERLTPDPGVAPTYDALFDVYCRLSGSLLPASHALGALR